MNSAWAQFKQDMSVWITPDALEQWATAVTTDTFDVRAELLQLAARFDRGKRMGEALRILDGFRDSTGALLRTTRNIVVGTIRILFEGGDPELTEQQLAPFRTYMKPNNAELPPWATAQWAGVVDRYLAKATNASKSEMLGFATMGAERNPPGDPASQARARALARARAIVNDDDDSTAEARKWLRGNRNRSALATTRFGPTAKALEFVEALYAAGATKVMVENIDKTADGGLGYADSMKVHLPKSEAMRQAIFRVINEIGQPETDGGPLEDDGEPSVGLWWD